MVNLMGAAVPHIGFISDKVPFVLNNVPLASETFVKFRETFLDRILQT